MYPISIAQATQRRWIGIFLESVAVQEIELSESVLCSKWMWWRCLGSELGHLTSESWVGLGGWVPDPSLYYPYGKNSSRV